MPEHNTAEICFNIAGELAVLRATTKWALRKTLGKDVHDLTSLLSRAEEMAFDLGRRIEISDPTAPPPAQCPESTPVESGHCGSGMITCKLCGIEWPESQGVGCPSCVHGPAEVATTQPEPEPPAVEAAWPDPSREPEPEASAVPECFGLAAPAPEPPKPRKTPQKTFAARYHAGQDRPINLGEIRAATVEEAKASLPQAFACQEVEIDGIYLPIDFAKIELVRVAGSTTPRPTSKALVNRPSYDVKLDGVLVCRIRGTESPERARNVVAYFLGLSFREGIDRCFAHVAMPGNDSVFAAAGGMDRVAGRPELFACFLTLPEPMVWLMPSEEAAHA